jgi:hypothetical protein
VGIFPVSIHDCGVLSVRNCRVGFRRVRIYPVTDSYDTWNFPASQANTVRLQRPALKLKKDTSIILFRNPMFMKHLFLYCGVDLPSVVLTVHFSLILFINYMYAYLLL